MTEKELSIHNIPVFNKHISAAIILSEQDLVEHLCDLYGIGEHTLKSTWRKRELVYIRYVMLWILKHKFKRFTLRRMGEVIGSNPKDHSTVLYGLEQITDAIAHPNRNTELIEFYKQIMDKCYFDDEDCVKLRIQEIWKENNFTPFKLPYPQNVLVVDRKDIFESKAQNKVMVLEDGIMYKCVIC